MQIICSQAYRFVGENGETFTVSPSPKPQNAPDWIRDTLLFQWALKDHSIQEIVPTAQVRPWRTTEEKGIGARIRELRLRAGLTIEELAAKTGISERSVIAHEAGQSTPRVSNLRDYRSVFEQELGIKLDQNLKTSP